MASVTKREDEKVPPGDVAPGAAPDANDREDGGAAGPVKVGYAGGAARTPTKPGFFTIYKKGQGYWTRMGTAIGAGVLGALITWQIYRYIPAFPAFQSATDPGRAQRIGMIAAAVFAVVYGLIVWRLMNKPANADFLIATDGEMKKV